MGGNRSGRERAGTQKSNGGRAMLNDVLAVCVGAAVVVVFATIFGAVELFWKGLQAARRVTGLGSKEIGPI